MPINRLIDIYEELARREQPGSDAPSLCVVAAEFLDVSGAGIAVVHAQGPMASVCTSNPAAEELMDLEVTLGEGPCQDACSSDGVIAEPDLPLCAEPKWALYGPLAAAAGARAVFGVPVRIGAIRLGALSLFNHHPGPLTESQSFDAHLMATVVGRGLLALQTGAPRGAVAEEILRQGPMDFAVHQAAGMVAVQGAMTVGEALARLRAHAFAINVTTTALAGRVVFRETVFDALSREWMDTGTSTR